MGKFEKSNNWKRRIDINDDRIDVAEETLEEVETRLDNLEGGGGQVQDVKFHGVVTEGQKVTVNVDTTKYDISAFDYYISGVKYTYSGSIENLTNFLNSGDFLVIGVNARGLVTKLNNFFTQSELDNTLEIARFSTIDGTNIGPVGDSYFSMLNSFKNFYKRMKSYEECKFLKDAVTINIEADRTMELIGGYIHTPNLEEKNIRNQTDLDVLEVYNVSGSYTIQPLSVDYVINNTQYDDGTDLVRLDNNKYRVHTLLFSSRTESFYFVISNNQYLTEAERLDSHVDYGIFRGTGSEICAISKIIVKEGNTEVISWTDERNKAGNIVSRSTRTFQNTYDRSSIPQIVLDLGKPLQFRNDITNGNDTIIEYTNNDNTEGYFKITKDGYVSTPVWKDNVQRFSRARGQGTREPTWSDMGNDMYGWRFDPNDELFVYFHVNHDYCPDTLAYPHVHWLTTRAMSRGQQVTWEFNLNVARGHQQGESLTNTSITKTVTYTADGTEIPGEHIITEVSDIDAIDILEPDTIVLCRVRLVSENVPGNLFGLMCDLHYLADRDGTPQKSPDFYVSNN